MLHDMTAAHLRNAYGGESMAHMRYSIWADVADKEGYPNVARLFRAIAYAEIVHATNHFSAHGDIGGAFEANSGGVFGVGNTSDNLQGGIDGETFEINEMYPVYLNAAEFQGEKEAKRSFHYALSAEKIHAAMYQQAKQAVDDGKDIALDTVSICDNCGYTVEGDIPDKCPICGVSREKFTSFS
jgi:rubrerythrin